MLFLQDQQSGIYVNMKLEGQLLMIAFATFRNDKYASMYLLKKIWKIPNN